MADAVIQLPPDSTGKKLAAESWTQGGDGTVHGQKLLIANGSGSVVAVLAPADDLSPTQAFSTNSLGYVFDGTNWDRARSALGANTGIPGVAGDSLVSTGTLSANGDLVSIDARAYRWASVQLTGTWTGTVFFEGSNDNSTWVAVAMTPVGGLSSSVTSTTVNGNAFHGAVSTRYFRVRLAWTSGTSTTATVLFSAVPAAQRPATSIVRAADGAEATVTTTGSDGFSSGNNLLHTSGLNYAFNGSNWDRVRGDVANGLDVDVTRLPSLPAGANNIGDVDVLTTPQVVDHDAVNTLPTSQVGGHATSEKAPTAEPAAVVAGDRVRAWLGLRGETVTRERTVPTYTCVGRVAAVNVRGSLSFLQVLNADKQWLTLHHAASATKLVRIRYAGFQIVDSTAASVLTFDLRLITAAPATPNPSITAAPHNVGNPATECVCMALPTTAGTMAATPSLAMTEFDTGILAPPTTVPAYNVGKVDLYPSGPAQMMEDEQPIELRPGFLDGVALVVRATIATTLQLVPIIRYTEETP